jgi:hypothetical protein
MAAGLAPGEMAVGRLGVRACAVRIVGVARQAGPLAAGRLGGRSRCASWARGGWRRRQMDGNDRRLGSRGENWRREKWEP